MTADMGAGGGLRVEIAPFVAIGGHLGQTLADNRAVPRSEMSSDDSSPGARYSEKFVTVVAFPFRKLPMPAGVLREGS